MSGARLFLFTLLFLYSFWGYSQQVVISGKVTDKVGKPVVNIPILLKNKENRILIFKNTNAKGQFSFVVSDTLTKNNLFLEINYLGYKNVRLLLLSNLSEYNVILEDNVVELAEVKISKKPLVNANGDTLSYNVSSFSEVEDRSIGDVLKRMPGIEIASNGQISYNGKPISNLYVGDDDLLDGKYALGTRTIPKEIIKSVDIMQNHQPIKALRNKKISDDIALNLVIKDDANLTLSGEGQVGLGLPSQYDLSFNTILLNKKIKMLNVLQANNIGIDYRDDLQQLGNSGLLPGMGNNRPATFLAATTVQNPNLPRINYYLNNSGILNANNLYNFKSGTQIRSNFQVFVDKNYFNYFNSTDYYLSDDTVRYLEAQDVTNKPFGISSTFKIMVNKENYYINNDLKINISKERNISEVILNEMDFIQNLKNVVQDYSNHFRYIPQLKNRNIMDVGWYINYYHSPQDLNIDRGLNPEILNLGVPYMGIRQDVLAKTFFSNASISYRIPKNIIRQNYLLSLVNEDQRLSSDLSLIQNDNQTLPYSKDDGNDLTWNRNRLSLNAFYEWKINKFEVIASLPIIAQQLKYYDYSSGLDKKKFDFFLNPSTRIKYFIAGEDYLQFNFNHNNLVGNIMDIYRGAILTDFRTLQSNAGQLQEQELSGLGLMYNLQRSISMLFINAGINYSNNQSSIITSSLIDNNIEQMVLQSFNNQIHSFNTKFGISKYFFDLNTTASLKLSWTRSQFSQIFNGQILPVENTGLTTDLKLESKLYKKLGISYSLVTTNNENSSNNFLRKIRLYNQNISFSHSTSSKLLTKLNARVMQARQIGTQDLNYFFLDANVRYKLVKLKSDFEIQLNNLTNVKQYETFRLNNNSSSYNKYELRGRTLMIKTTFYL